MIEKEGWIESEYLPQGWLTKSYIFPRKRDDRFLNTKFELLKGKSMGLKELLYKGYTNREISNFISGFIEEQYEPDAIVWEDDSRIPNGWKVGSVQDNKLYVMPSGHIATIKKTVKRNVKSSTELKEEAKEKFLKFIEEFNGIRNKTKLNESTKYSLGYNETNIETKNKEEEPEKKQTAIAQLKDWVPPTGWVRNTKGAGFKTPDRNYFRSAVQVVKYLRNNGYSEDYIDQYKEKGQMLSFKKSNDLPLGWREAKMKVGVMVQKWFMSPNGTILQSRPLAIKYMMDNLFERSHIETMISFLKSEDGWQYDENLPEGWMKKDYKKSATRYTSPTFETFKRKNDVMEFLGRQSLDKKVIIRIEKYLYAGKSPPTKSIKEEPCASQEIAKPTVKKLKIEKEALDRKTDPSMPLDCHSAQESDKKQHSFSKEIHMHITNPESDKFCPPDRWIKMAKGFRIEEKNLETAMEVVQYLRSNGYSEDYIDHFKETGLSMKFKRKRSLSPGWREAVKNVEGCKGGVLTQKRYMSPNGTVLLSRAHAVKFMMDNLFERSHIETMFTLLKNQDGWQNNENLPEGWMEKEMKSKNSKKFLSPTFEIFKQKNDVINFMKDQGLNSEVIKRAEGYLYHGKRPPTMSIKREPSTNQESSAKRIKNDKEALDWKPDSSLPSGWLSARDSENRVHISNSKGDTFSSRIEAMRAMIETKQSPDDIFKMWKSLDLEGWVCDEDHLPPGWRRKHSDDSETHTYLSPLMEVIESSKAFLEHIENSSDYNNDDIKKVNTWIKINEL